MFQISGDMFFAEKKAPAGWHLAHKGLVKHNRITKNRPNSRILIRASFPASYPTILDDLCGKFDGTATRSQWEGSRKQQKYKSCFKSGRYIYIYIYLSDLKPHSHIQIFRWTLMGPLKRTQNDKIPQRRVPNFWGHVLGRKKSPCGVTSDNWVLSHGPRVAGHLDWATTLEQRRQRYTYLI